MTTESLEALVANINFIDVCLKLLDKNHDARCVAYITAMKDMFKQIPLNMIKALTTKQKVQKIMTYISGGWYMKKGAKGIPTLKILKLSQNNKIRRTKFRKTV